MRGSIALLLPWCKCSPYFINVGGILQLLRPHQCYEWAQLLMWTSSLYSEVPEICTVNVCIMLSCTLFVLTAQTVCLPAIRLASEAWPADAYFHAPFRKLLSCSESRRIAVETQATLHVHTSSNIMMHCSQCACDK